VGPDPVVVLGAGVITPLGHGLDGFWTGLVAGADSISTIERVRVEDLKVRRGAEIKKLPDELASMPCRASALLLAAADDLVGRVAISAPPGRVGVVLGTALGGVGELERALSDGRSVRAVAGGLYDAPAHALAAHLAACGPILTVSTACASGATALGLGAELLQDDRADLVVAGGYDILCRFVLRGFDALRSLTRDRVRPFDRRRSGLLLGEAAALVLLARARDVRGRGFGRLLGHASAADGYHVTAPDPEGRGLERAVRAALESAAVDPDTVDLVSAHGTGTPVSDRVESAVLRRVLGGRAEQVPVNSIKGALGHTMGAAAVLEALMCLLAARDGLVPPTVGYEEPDPECGLDYVPGVARSARPRVMLSTSAGFGGCNAAVVLEGAA